MIKKLWRWLTSLLGIGQKQQKLATQGISTPLDDADYEYLFMQLLEGVAHGWQQPRVIRFFQKIKYRSGKSQWLTWLDNFGSRLLSSNAPNYDLAGRMVQLGQLECGEITDKAGEIGMELLSRQGFFINSAIDESPNEYEITPPPLEIDYTQTFDQHETIAQEDDAPSFGFVPVDLRLDPSGILPVSNFNNLLSVENNVGYSQVPPELQLNSTPTPAINQPQPEEIVETREITLDELEIMLNSDPELVEQLSAQLGIETADPQVILKAIIAQISQPGED